MNMDDIFSQFGDFRQCLGGGGGSKVNWRVANGVEKKVKVKRKVQAPGVSYKTCSTCNGQGQVMRVTTILGRMQSASTCPNLWRIRSDFR
jgi:molecular chaperone DnaJ